MAESASPACSIINKEALELAGDAFGEISDATIMETVKKAVTKRCDSDALGGKSEEMKKKALDLFVSG